MDITTLGRMISGLPRDVDITANTLQMLSLKVGTTSPAELTKAMADLMVTIYTPGQGLPGANVSSGAKQDILEQKLIAVSSPVHTFLPTEGNTADDVTTQVLAATAVHTPVGAGGSVHLVNTKGIFVGTVSGANDLGKVLIRVASSDNGVEDGNGDEVYGVLSESGGVFTLNYKKSDGSPYTILATDTGFDFYFVEVADLYSFGLTRLLTPAIGGVIDHATFEHTLAETTARMNADSTLQAHINTEITARSNADSTLQGSINSEITARIAADSAIQAIIDDTTARQNADSTLQANINSEITARIAADSTVHANILVETTARLSADSTLQAELDRTEGSIGPAVSGSGNWLGFSGTNYMDAASNVTDAFVAIDGSLYGEATARANADSTLQSRIDSEITARMNGDSTIQSNLNVETTARVAADSTLQGDLNVEITARMNADSTIQGLLDVETTARLNADSTLQGNLDVETTARLDADSTLQGNLNIEITARKNADSTLQGNLNVEITSRLNADSTLQGNLNTETTARLNADSTLLANINNKKVAVVDITFVAGESIIAGDVVYESKTAAGEVLKANASAIATCETILGVATESKSATQPIKIRTFGEAIVNTDGTNFDLGKRVYVSVTAGKASKFAPSSEQNVVYLLGNATDIGKVSVNPNLEYIVDGSFVSSIVAGSESVIAANNEAVVPAS